MFHSDSIFAALHFFIHDIHKFFLQVLTFIISKYAGKSIAIGVKMNFIKLNPAKRIDSVIFICYNSFVVKGVCRLLIYSV